MKIRTIIAALALFSVAAAAQAQTTNPWPRFIPVRPDGTVIDPGSVGGGSGGTVQQGTLPWQISGNGTANSSTNPIFTQITSGTIAATQSGPWSVTLGAGTNAIGSVLADLRVAGAAVSSSNPVSVAITNFPASQLVANSGTFAVQNTAAVVGGNSVAVKTDSSATTQPVSSTTLATAANQNSTAAGTSATNAQAVQGVTNGVPLNIQGGNATAVKTDSSATTQPVSATAWPLSTGAATAANQTSEITQLTTIAQRVIYFTDTSGTSVGSGAAYNGTVRDTGVPSSMSRFTAAAYSSQTGTLVAQACLDSACANAIPVASATIPAGGGTTTVTAPLTSRYSRVVFNMGTTAGTVLIFSSFSAN